MRKALLGGVLLAAFTFASPAGAGCWATVGLAPPPNGLAAGKTWTAELKVLQHGRNPLPDAADAKPTVTIINRATDDRRTFTAKATDPAAGLYEAKVVFPSPGALGLRGLRRLHELQRGSCSLRAEPQHRRSADRRFGAAQQRGRVPGRPARRWAGRIAPGWDRVLYLRRRNGLQHTGAKT